MSKDLSFSVVVIAYNEEKNIQKSLNSLERQTVLPEEIIVIDNNSKDRTSEIANSYDGVRVVKEIKQGMSYARNRGFNEAKGNVLIKMDADTVLDSHFFENLKKRLELENDFVGVVPFVNFDNWFWNILFSWKGVSYVTQVFLGYRTLPGPVYVLTKDAWKKIEECVCNDDSLVHEDTEISLHLANIGKVIYAKNCKADTSSRRIVENPYSFFIEYRIRVLTHYWRSRALIPRLGFLFGRKNPYKGN